MKNSPLNLLTGLPELVAVFGLLGSLVVLNAAAEIPTGKGDATRLMKPSPVVAETTSPAMMCSSCTDVSVTRKDMTARGANKPDVAVARHLCPGCATTLQAVGSGKSKQDVISHRCTVSTMTAGCCTRPQSDPVLAKPAKGQFQIAPMK